MIFRKKGKRIKNKPIVEEMVELWETSAELEPNDVLGSYTGTPNYDKNFEVDDLVPEQDADDL